MKKRILALLLTLALVLPAVSCDVLLSTPGTSATPVETQSQNNRPADTEKSPVSVAPETQPQTPPDSEPADSQPANQPDETEYVEPETEYTEPETEYVEPETEEPLPFAEPYEAGVIESSFDTFYVNGVMYFTYDGGADTKLDELGNLVTFKSDEACQSMMLRGWTGFTQEIERFGYYIDTYDFIYGDFATATEDNVKMVGGEYASRFEIFVSLDHLDAGEYCVGFVAKLTDGTVVRLREEITVVIEKTYWQNSDIVTHLSFDELDMWADGVEFADIFIPGTSPDWNGVANCDLAADSLRYRGWIGAIGNAVGRFGYRINGGKAVYDDSFTIEPEDSVVDAALNTGATVATRMGIYIPLTSLSGNDNTVTILYRDDAGNVVILTEFTVNLPEDPMKPVNVFFANDLDTFTLSMNIRYAEVVRGSFLHIVPDNGDPNYYPFADVTGARYVAIRYRTTDAFGADMQIYMASSGVGPTDDSSMLRQPVVVDGEWHVAIFDTRSLMNAGIYNGAYVSYFRFDPLEAGYKLNEYGQPYKPDGQNYARYELPEGCSIDVSYIAFFHTVEAINLFDEQVERDNTFFDGEIPEDSNSNGLALTINGDGTYTVTSIGSCTESDLVIPEQYLLSTVTRIAPRAFWGANQLTSVVIPDSVKIIDQDAFPYCENLKTVYLGRGLESIGSWAFYGCPNLTDIHYAGSKAEWNQLNEGQQWYSGNVIIHFNSAYQP